ncbi:hypothetical protein ZHAS_00009817 [Anopheles sinensis]|uniref:Uncharacterized protein n=1 Tax=Anopheles sinensis TaxID=74873 RepID=A0A084VW09_ANOSI|nr:hypothetical protein ZHAS_00009817 [Anopheles sinensis]
MERTKLHKSNGTPVKLENFTSNRQQVLAAPKSSATPPLGRGDGDQRCILASVAAGPRAWDESQELLVRSTPQAVVVYGVIGKQCSSNAVGSL